MHSELVVGASTESATLRARPRTRSPSTRAASKPIWRGDGGKNTKPTMSAPASSAASSASGVVRPQILISTGMPGSGFAAVFYIGFRRFVLPVSAGRFARPMLFRARPRCGAAFLDREIAARSGGRRDDQPAAPAAGRQARRLEPLDLGAQRARLRLGAARRAAICPAAARPRRRPPPRRRSAARG